MKPLHTTTIVLLFSVAISLDTRTPLIGVLMQPGSDGFDHILPSPLQHYVYVANSYVEWISQTGAIAVLVPYDLPQSKFRAILNNLDGFLLPGGGTDLKDKEGKDTPYHAVARNVLRYSEEMLDVHGKTWPVFAICLGFEDAGMHYLGNAALTDGMNDITKEHPVIVEEDAFKESKFFSKLDQKILRTTFEKGSVYYAHDLGFDYTTLAKPEFSKVKEDLLILGHSFSDTNLKFVAFFEHKKYPVYATMFHPEKVLFERGEIYRFLDRSTEALDFSADVAESFVELARANSREYSSFPTWLKPFFSSFWTPVQTFSTNFERIFVMPRYTTPITPPKPNDKSEAADSDLLSPTN